ncbi:hydantoinase/oxoprolinase family protein [Lichenihabitans sp. Uapishka_5]|uniref:hydantoinase/oxoprolinase family protein n=1 Tax=Lichenihabitans sp. Uapishka_5 TaxID=3037302 RepID=UPI0029E7E11A|nr:hydantoinase/oxoprolinase family protein [Lichenihabitans sp. Uapishka_5]MDX7952558.1 hydantoinase/oxoprolinase family protein [Lichenihabitans sp. Uapishka_5]
MSPEIAVDVGGTFTDLVLRTGDGQVRTYKSSTTKLNIALGIFAGLDRIAADLGVTRGELLATCGSFACGTTIATNAILERKTARTALLCTMGFRDTLLIREGGKPNNFDMFVDYPDPLIPRSRTIGIDERINAEGGIERPLAEADVEGAVALMREWEVEAVAVALLWSIANPAHELRIGEILRSSLPGVPFSLSHRVNPTIREYRRTSAAALDASLKPVVQHHIHDLEERLRAAGFKGTLTFVTSNGGRASSEAIINKPVFICLSGPSGAPQAASRLVREEGIAEASGNIVCIDMGGTSLDVSVIQGWEIPSHREGSIGGHVFGVPSVDVETIGAGGGSIARVDAGGLIHSGPESAGAFPGPACYGRGGTLPTVTDANLVRGLLSPDNFAAGQIKLSVEAAVRAVREHVAEPLGMTVEDAANLICFTTEQNMVAAIEGMTVQKGLDPRSFVLVSGGAAGGLHAASLARELRIPTVLIPRAAGVLSAYGISTGDVKFNFTRSAFSSSVSFDFDRVGTVLAEIRKEAIDFLEGMGVPDERRHLSFSTQARYAGQVWHVTLGVPDGRIRDAEDLAALVEAFHVLHERLNSMRAEGDPVEFVEWDVLAVGRNVNASPPAEPQSTGPADSAERLRRVVHLRELDGPTAIPVYDGPRLCVGQVIEGPALIEDPLTVNLVPPRSTAVVTAQRGILLSLR